MKKSLVIFYLIFSVLLLSSCSLNMNQNSNNNQSGQDTVKIEEPTESSLDEYRIGSQNNSYISNSNNTKNKTQDKTETYIANKKSKKFHRSDCESVNKIKDENKIVGLSKENLMKNGYEPCKSCNP